MYSLGDERLMKDIHTDINSKSPAEFQCVWKDKKPSNISGFFFIGYQLPYIKCRECIGSIITFSVR